MVCVCVCVYSKHVIHLSYFTVHSVSLPSLINKSSSETSPASISDFYPAACLRSHPRLQQHPHAPTLGMLPWKQTSVRWIQANCAPCFLIRSATVGLNPSAMCLWISQWLSGGGASLCYDHAPTHQ